nr:MAG TPA: hypothetical protein [Caudoviricetes sp.]
MVEPHETGDPKSDRLIDPIVLLIVGTRKHKLFQMQQSNGYQVDQNLWHYLPQI